jgi:acylphosphatase
MGAWLRIEGSVQGVSFRYYTQKEAQKLGLTGWVWNQADGSVEAAICGEKTAELVAWCQHGPPMARVRQVTEKPISEALTEEDARWTMGLTSFVIVR